MTTVVVLSGDASQFIRELQKAEHAEKGVEQAFHDVTKAAAETTESVERIGKAGRKGQTEIDLLLKELRRTGPEGGRAARAMEKSFQDAGTHGRRSVQQIIDKIGEIDPAAKSAFDAFELEARQAAEELERQFQESTQIVDAKLVKLHTPMDALKEKVRSVFGPDGLQSVSSYGVAIGTVTAALAAAAKGFEILKENQDAAINSLQAQEPAEKRLAQIATSAKDLDAMLKQADQIAVDAGLGREQARNLVFSARSEGFAGDINQIARFGRVVDVESQGTLAGSLGRLFAGEGLTTEQRLSGVLAAAETSAFDFETVGRSVKKSAAPASQAGADLAETLAANATLANLIGETAGDRLKAFSSKVAQDPTLAGGGIIAAVKQLQGMNDEQRRKFLGESIELNEAYTLLSNNMAEVEKITTTVRNDLQNSKTGQGVLGTRTRIVEGSERFQTRERLRRSEIQKEIAEENRFAQSGAGQRITENAVDAAYANSGVSTTAQGIFELSPSQIPLVGSMLPEVTLRDAVTYGSQAVGISPEVSAAGLASAAAMVPGSDYNMGMYGRFMGAVSPDFRIQQAMLAAQRAGSSAIPSSPQSNSNADLVGAIKEQTEVMKQQLEASKTTAENTAPQRRPPNYGSALNSGAAAAGRDSL